MTRHVRATGVGRWTAGHAVVADGLLAVGADGISEMSLLMALLHEMSGIARMLGLRVAVTSAGIKVILVGGAVLSCGVGVVQKCRKVMQ